MKIIIIQSKSIYKLNRDFILYRIIQLESQLLEDKKESSEYIQKMTQEHNKQIELNETMAEKYELTIQNLEKVNDDITQQYTSANLTHTKEKELNIQLQKQIEEVQKKNKEVKKY